MTERPQVGLASNPDGVPFRCDHCKFFSKHTCHNDDPKLYGRTVEPDWCCDFFKHPGMRVIIK
jgi:hypothetical protein